MTVYSAAPATRIDSAVVQPMRQRGVHSADEAISQASAAPPATLSVKGWLLEHLDDHYGLYGAHAGVRSARKHIGWAVRGLPGGEAFRDRLNRIEHCDEQARALAAWFDVLADTHPVLPTAAANDATLAPDLADLAA